ncbi:FAD-dependent oxidoreductase, partial [Limnoraphis robusta]|uniref:FAD-dependent oxidoreductase n=1 Tax=Limnoraphis robusta TaxID=1118279 RepID=UPI003AFF7F72
MEAGPVGDVAVIGGGYVGAVTAACLAELGHRVLCIELDPHRATRLQAGESPIHEPGLTALLQRGLASGRLIFTSEYPNNLETPVVFLAVNTPGAQGGAADLRAVRDAVGMVA